MSMLRCLYRRLKFVKCALGEPGNSGIHLKVTTSSRASYQCIFTRNLNGMTCNKNNQAGGSSESAAPAASAAEGKADGSLIPNGLIVDSALRSCGTFLSNGYYRTEWGQQGSGNQTNGEKARRGNTSKCEFDLNFINVRLLGLLGTAVAVGINVNSHINDWMPYQNRGIHDLCSYQYHRKHPSLYGSSSSNTTSTVSNGSQCGASPSPLSRAIDCPHAKSNNEVSNFISSNTSEIPSTTTTISCCRSCRSCSDLLNKILQVYSTFPTGSSSGRTTSIASSILNVLPRSTATALPPVVYSNGSNHLGSVNQADSSAGEQFFADEVDGGTSIVGVDLTSSTGLRRLQFDSVSNSSNAFNSNNKRRTSPVPVQKPEKKQQSPKQQDREESPPPRFTQRKKSIYQITEEESAQLQQLAVEKSVSSQSSDYISLSASSDESSVTADEEKAASPAPTSQPPKLSSSLSTSSSSSSSTSEDEPDIATVFRLASIEYADQLNNLVAISLMDTHHPDEAMQFWSSCEASSRAFFNMGVAYESGRHAKRAKPDFDRAHDCYALAASMGHRDAIYNLSLFYLYGKGKIEVNVERGLELLETAAVKGVVAAQKFIVELRRTQFIDELREDLQRTRSRVDILKDRPQRTSNAHFRPPLRPSPSLFGPTATPLKMKQSTAAREGDEGAAAHSSLSKKRSNSFPDLLSLNDSPNAIAAK